MEIFENYLLVQNCTRKSINQNDLPTSQIFHIFSICMPIRNSNSLTLINTGTVLKLHSIFNIQFKLFNNRNYAQNI